MGQKVNPISLRLGITQQWRSRWYADKKHFGEYVVEDQRIRRFIKRNYYYAGITKIEIERAAGNVQVTDLLNKASRNEASASPCQRHLRRSSKRR